MTGLKIASMTCIMAATDAMNPVLGLPFEQITAMSLSAFCVWQMWQLIQRREKALSAKDEQVNKLISVMENRPCLHGALPVANKQETSK